MHANRVRVLLLAFLLGLTVSLGGCAMAPKQPQEETSGDSPAAEVLRGKEKKASKRDRVRTPLPDSEPAKGSDDMERLD